MRQQWEKYREQERFKAIAKWALRSHLMMLNEGLEAKKETYCAKKSIQLIRFYQTNNIINFHEYMNQCCRKFGSVWTFFFLFSPTLQVVTSW